MADLVQEPTEILNAQDVHVTFRVGRRELSAVRGVSVSVHRGETVAVVGESGSGKSTLALALMRAHEPERGRIVFENRDITHLSRRELRPLRKRMQMIFQNPYASLDPRMTVGALIGEPLTAFGYGSRAKVEARVLELLDEVGLSASSAKRLPAQFSGGQRQRISIARALALRPSLVIADEPVSALDVSVQAQIVSLLADIQKREHVAYLVIAHDLALVHHISDRIVVMYLGEVVEEGPTARVIETPQHPYTASLLSATPSHDGLARERIVLSGDPPSAMDRPSGCAFHPRCPIVRDRCRTEAPTLQTLGSANVACFYPGEIRPVITREQTSVDLGGSLR